MIIAGQSEVIARWVQARVPDSKFDCPAGFGVARDGRLAAGVIFHNFDAHRGDIELTLAADSPRWATKEMFQAAFAYPFLQLGCRRVTVRIQEGNYRARKLIEGTGFKLEGLLRNASAEGGGLLIYGMLREECRWLTTRPDPRMNHRLH